MKRLVVLGSEGAASRILVRELALTRLRDVQTYFIVERREPMGRFLTRRCRRLGWTVVLGQLAFQACGRLLAHGSRARRNKIWQRNGWCVDLPQEVRTLRVDSVNDRSCRTLLRQIAPDVVVLSGTRILSGALIKSLPVPLLNLHAGITPAYRGVHGGYWALAEGDPEKAGVTIHRVDHGIDTGAVIQQERIRPTPDDNYATYFWLQLEVGLPLLNRAVDDVFAGTLHESAAKGPSRLHSHPTLWGYWHRRWTSGVK